MMMANGSGDYEWQFDGDNDDTDDMTMDMESFLSILDENPTPTTPSQVSFLNQFLFRCYLMPFVTINNMINY